MSTYLTSLRYSANNVASFLRTIETSAPRDPSNPHVPSLFWVVSISMRTARLDRLCRSKPSQEGFVLVGLFLMKYFFPCNTQGKHASVRCCGASTSNAAYGSILTRRPSLVIEQRLCIREPTFEQERNDAGAHEKPLVLNRRPETNRVASGTLSPSKVHNVLIRSDSGTAMSLFMSRFIRIQPQMASSDSYENLGVSNRSIKEKDQSRRGLMRFGLQGPHLRSRISEKN